MPPYPPKRSDTTDDDDETVDSDSAESNTMPLKKESSSFTAKKRRNLTMISKKYDLDGDGVLDEAEQVMRDRDVANRGFLTNDEIYHIVQEELRAKKSAGHMKRLIAGLICFVVLLALSNLGTSLASAVLAKDLKASGGGDQVENNADGTTSKSVPSMKIVSTGKTAAAQTVADTYDATEMTSQQFEERRRLVLSEMDEDPHSHTHRRNLKNCKMGRSRDSDCTGTSISFDSSVMREEEFSVIEAQCSRNENVYVRRSWGDGADKNTRNECICQRGTSVIVKQKKGKRKNKNNNNNDFTDVMEGNGGTVSRGRKKNKKSRGRDREVIMERPDGKIMHVDCVSGLCYCGGEVLQGDLGDDCLLRADECRSDYVCQKSNNNDKSSLRNNSSSRYGTCMLPSLQMDILVTRNAKPRDYCNVDSEWDACTKGYYCLEGVKRSGVGTCTSTVGFGQYCSSDYQCGKNNFCDGVCTKNRRVNTSTVIIKLKARADEVCDVSYGMNACVRNYACLGRNGVTIGSVGTGFCQMRTVTVVTIGNRAGLGQVCDVSYNNKACAADYVCRGRNGVDIGSVGTGTCQVFNFRNGGNGSGAGAGEVCQASNGANACISTHVCLGPNSTVLRSGQTGFCQWGSYSQFYGGGGCAGGPNRSGGDCTNDRCCGGGWSCNPSNLNGSDRWVCS